MTNSKFNKTLIIGLGLIGGSLAKAILKNSICDEIWAVDSNKNSLNQAKKDNIIVNNLTDFEKINQFDLVILATPLGEYQKIFNKIYNIISPKVIFFDIGSLKNLQFDNIPSNFVRCHPIAGSDLSGYENSNENIFDQRNFIICPKSCNNQQHIKIISDLVIKIKAKPIIIDCEKHDKIFTLISHLPQFLSFLSNNISPKNIKNSEIQKAFRLDNSNPLIWQEIFGLNHDNLELFYQKFFANFINFAGNLKKINLTSIFDDSDLAFYVNSSYKNLDENSIIFFEKNFSALLIRFLIVISYLKISDVKSYFEYAGQGFKDFISIINIFYHHQNICPNLIKQNSQQIEILFSKIIN